VDGYNHSYHSTTKRRPVDVAKGLQQPVEQTKVSITILPIGTRVRLVTNRERFNKGYEAKWSKRIYTVNERKGNRYIVDGPGTRTYKSEELQVVTAVERAPAGIREIAQLHDTFTQYAKTKRVPRKNPKFQDFTTP
jgi:hypothetical protein